MHRRIATLIVVTALSASSALAGASRPELLPEANPAFSSDVVHAQAFKKISQGFGDLFANSGAGDLRIETGEVVTFGEQIEAGAFEAPRRKLSLGRGVVIDAIVGPTGEVLDARHEIGGKSSVGRAFAKYVETFRFEPALHAELGPVPYRVLIRFLPGHPGVDGAPERIDESPLHAGRDGVTKPRRTENVFANFPDYARQARVDGKVWLKAVIATDGTVSRIEVLESSERYRTEFEFASIAALSLWRYEPATRDGKPVPVAFTTVTKLDVSSQRD